MAEYSQHDATFPGVAQWPVTWRIGAERVTLPAPIDAMRLLLRCEHPAVRSSVANVPVTFAASGFWQLRTCSECMSVFYTALPLPGAAN